MTAYRRGSQLTLRPKAAADECPRQDTTFAQAGNVDGWLGEERDVIVDGQSRGLIASAAGILVFCRGWLASSPRIPLTLRLPPRGDSRVRQRPKRLPHVVEFTKRRLELFPTLPLPSSSDTTTPVHKEQQNAGDR